MIGRVLDGRYRLDKVVGSGGMGAVYEATHTGTGRRVAVKLIQQMALGDTDVWNRFQREARASSTIDTRHIVEVIDSGRDPETGLPFMAMELLRGEDLGALIERKQRGLDASLAVRLVAQACIGLAKAHRAFVVHRDIKPANLFLTEEAESDEVIVKLLDFGIAKVRPATPLEGDGLHLTQTGKLLGTPLYMSPEQAQGAKDIDARTDIWSIGAVLYEALTGQSPFCDADNLGKLILAICSRPPPKPSSLTPVAPEIEAIVMRCLSIEREQRFATTDELLDALLSLDPDGSCRVGRSEVWEGAGAPARPNLGMSGSRRSRPSDMRVRPSPGRGPNDTRAIEEAGVASTLFASSNTGHVPATDRRRRNATLAALGVIGLGAVGVVAWLVGRSGDDQQSAHATAAAPSTSAEPSRTPTIVAELEIVPADATVRVAGEVLAVSPGRDGAGKVSLDCTMGEEVIVTISRGDLTRKQIVTIRETGPDPARISLEGPTASPSAAQSADVRPSPKSSAAERPATTARPTSVPRPSAAPVPTHEKTFE